MKIVIATLADAANVTPPDKLNILGAFHTAVAASFPATLPGMALVLRLQVEFDDVDANHQLAVSIRNDDGKEAGRAEIAMHLPPFPAGEIAYINQILNFAGVEFRREGRYSFQVTWDGVLVMEVPLRVRLMPPIARVPE